MLVQLGKLDNIVIIFILDNGFFWGEYSIIEKGNVYEEFLLVLLVMVGLGIFVMMDFEYLVFFDFDVVVMVIDMVGIDRFQVDGFSLILLFG